MEPLVSIIIPTYKRSEKIKRIIDSCLKQTYQNIEIIIVDDNLKYIESRNKTIKISKDYHDNRIKFVYCDKSLGAANARNYGVKHSRGNYIAFLDDDDEMTDDRIEKQLSVFLNSDDNNLGLVLCFSESVDNKGLLIKKYHPNLTGNLLYNHITNQLAATSMIMVTRNCFNVINGFEVVRSKQDYLFILKIIAQNFNVSCVNEYLIKYIEHDEDRISKLNLNKIEDEFIAYNFQSQYHSLLTKKELKNVNHYFYVKISNMYFYLNNQIKALNYFFKALRYKFFTFSNLKMSIKLIIGKTITKKLVGD